MSEGFNQPAQGGGYFEPKNAVGHLVLITRVHEVYHNPSNVYAGKPQPRDEAKVDIVDLDGDQQLRERVIVTHPGLVNRLVAGSTNVLGRIGTVPTEKGNPAFVLDRFDEQQDVPRAQAWVQAYQSGQFQQAPPAPQAPPQGAYQAPPAQSAPQPGYAPQGGQSAPYGAPQGQPQYAPPAQQGYAPPPQAQQQPGVQIPEGVDPAQLQALMQQLGGQPIPQQQGQQPPY